jgi:hypothetical protein
MKNLLIIYFFCILFINCFSQIKVIQQIDIETDDKHGSQYTLYPLDNKGVISILESKDYLRGGHKALIINYLDTTLQTIWQTKPVIKYEHTIAHITNDRTSLYLLIQKKITEYDVLEIDIATGNYQLFKIEDIVPLEITLFKVHRKILYLGGEVEGRPAVLWFNYLKDKTPKVLPQINQHRAILKEICFSEDGEVVSVLTKNSKQKHPNIFIHNFSLEGRLLNKIAFPEREEYNFLTFRLWTLNETEQWVIGTYAHRNKDLAQGFYTLLFADGESKIERKYDFYELANFLNYLENRKEKLIEKAKDKHEKGKVKAWDLHLLVNHLQLIGNKLLLTGELYRPINQNNVNASNNKNFNALLQNRMRQEQFYYNVLSSGVRNNIVNGLNTMTYQYKEAFAVVFDRKGNLVWDNTMVYKDLELPFLTFQTSFALTNDTLVALHSDNEALKTKVMLQSQTLQEVTTQKTDTLFAKTKQLEQWNTSNQSWYNQYFLLSGIQRVRFYDASKGASSKEIFFISKVCWLPKRKEKTIQETPQEK